ncbi:WD40 repeat-like protein [Athelia psychrophila]|uniref:WD40 repeat-like protein n=2 Tax=Athelia psychrophila TaxID=1759441 RepID=A0A167THF7_9AGAM|nr:WD40 repeat-like protein [Fibularhizoctonia sp. CBS 109695]
MGHTAVSRFVAYSPDGKRVASCSDDKMIRVWDTETGEMVGSPFKAHAAAMLCIAYSPDGKCIASGSGRMIRVWDAETGEAVGAPLEGHTNTVLCLSYSPDGQRIASGSGDRTIRVWDGKTGKAVGLPFKGHTDRINSVAYSPDGKHIASGSNDCTVRVWDAETGEAVGLPLEGHSKSVQSVAYFPDGKHIVSGSFDSTIRVWDGKTGHTVGEPFKGHGSIIWSVACSPDGTRIASGSEDCTIRVWDAEIVDREAVQMSLQKPLSDFWSVAYSRDGASIVSGDGNGGIQVWDAGTGKAAGAPLKGHRDLLRSIAYSPDGTCIASGSDDKTIRRWELVTGKEVGLPLEGHRDVITSVVYAPDGKCIVSGSRDKTIRIWDAITGEEVMSIEDCKAMIYSVAYSPDGKCIVSGHSNGVIQVWNAATGEKVGLPFKGHTSSICSVAYSPDGTRIASGAGDDTVRVWDATTGKAIGSPLKGHSGIIWSVAYSPDGKRIASGSSDCTVRVWDAETGLAFRAPFKVHVDGVTSVAFSPDGTHIVSGSADNTIRVWVVDSVTCTSESAIGFTHDSVLDNGWIMTPSSQLLVWVPSWYRTGLVWPNNTAVIGPSLTELDLSDFVHGSDWQECGNTLQIAPYQSSRPPVPDWQGGRQERGATGEDIPPVKPQPTAPDPLDPLGLADALPAELVVILRRLAKTGTTRRALEELKTYVEAGAAKRDAYAVREMLPVWLHHAPLLLLHPPSAYVRSLSPCMLSLYPILAEEAPLYVLGVWLMIAHDPDKHFASVASTSFSHTETGTGNVLPFLRQEGEGETDRNARLRIGVLGALAGILDISPPAPEPEQPDTEFEEDQAEDPALVSCIVVVSPVRRWKNPEIKKEKNAIPPILSRSPPRSAWIESDVGVSRAISDPLLVFHEELADSAPAQTEDREGDDNDVQYGGEHDDDQDQEHDPDNHAEGASAYGSFIAFLPRPTTTGTTYTALVVLLSTFSPSSFLQSQRLSFSMNMNSVVKMSREKLVVMGGELIDSRARVRELKADCIKDKQGIKESVKQLLASSQQMTATPLHLRTQQQESLDALACAAEAEGKLNAAQEQIADMLLVLDEQSKKLEILAEVEHDNTNLKSYLHEKEIEVNSLNSKVCSLNQTYTLASITRSKRALYWFKSRKSRIRNTSSSPCLHFAQRQRLATLTYLGLSILDHEFKNLRQLSQRLSILKQHIAKGKDTIDDYHSNMGQADIRYQLLQERFDEQSLTLRITKEANDDLNVCLNDWDEQMKRAQSTILIWHTALKLIADKWQADLVTTQQTITALNGRLVEMTITQEKNASLKATADKYQADLVVTPQMSAALNGQLETLNFQFQCQRDSDKVIAQVDLTVAQATNAATGELEG